MIYGANGSGKSNIMTALHALDVLMRATSDDKDDEIPFIESFKFNSETVSEPSVLKYLLLLLITSFITMN